MAYGLKILAVVLATVSLIPAGYSLGSAQEYPTKPINVIIQYPAGGSTDLAARAMANAAKKYLGQPMICENKAGGGGTIGVAHVTTRPPDGYTLGIVTSSPTIAYHMRKLNFHPLDDLTHIMRWGWYLSGFVVRADAPWTTMPDLLKYARENPDKVSYGSPGVGTPAHLATEELSMVAGTRWIHIPGKGIAENNAALLGGHIDVISDTSGWAPLVDAGKFRLLATWGFKRSARYPNVITIRETGYDVVCPAPIGLIGPKGMPKPIVAKVHDAFRKALEDPEFLAVMKKFDMDVMYLNPEEYEKYMRSDSERIERLVKKLGLDKK